MGEDKIVCACKKVSRKDVLKAVRKGARSYKEVRELTGAGSKCGHCEEKIRKIVKKALKEQEKASKPDKQGKQDQQAGKAAAPQAIRLCCAALDCPEPVQLADFYCRLLGWELADVESGEWVDIQPPGGGVRIGFQHNALYVPPVWPEREGEPQQQAHLDFAVKDREELALMVARALAEGAREADEQFSDNWHVMIDPAGHPFCFVLG